MPEKKYFQQKFLLFKCHLTAGIPFGGKPLSLLHRLLQWPSLDGKTETFQHLLVITYKGGDRPTQLLSTCFSQLRVWLERVCHLRICPFFTKRSGDLDIFRYVAVVVGLNAIFA